jgi:predicted alpha/beta-hydrolase family hydrolase
MADETVKIEVADGRSITAIRTPATGGDSGWTWVYAPGAGSGIRDPFGVYASARLASQDFTTVRFQFPYAEEGKRAPNRNPTLELTWNKVIETFRADGVKMAVGGRSMGGRIASQVVAQGTEVDALTLLAYPLHPPNNPESLRDKHLPDVSVPTLFCSGTRDNFGTPDELREATAKVAGARLHLLDSADHGFSVLKASGRRRQDVWDEVIDVMVSWLGDFQ